MSAGAGNCPVAFLALAAHPAQNRHIPHRGTHHDDPPNPPTRPPTPLLTLAIAAAALAAPSPATAQDLPTIEAHTEGTTAMEGFFNLYWDDDAGSLYWEIAELDTEFLYQISMGSGLGSNPVGIDRGQLRGTHVFEARRIGPRVLLVEPNYEFRAITDNTAWARSAARR